jgi:hypothetical protein
MKVPRSLKSLALSLLLTVIGTAVFAQDTVTIPKSRLEELERKEAELEKLFTATNRPQTTLQAPQQLAPPKTTVDPIPPRASPPANTLPPLDPGETVDATMLADNYLSDAASSDQRYRKRKFVVRGEVAGFQKPMFRRDYKLILKTPSKDAMVVCAFLTPEKYGTVFTVKNGSELVGLIGETRVPLLSVGQMVEIEGKCTGFRDSAVNLVSCELKSPHP